MAKEKTKTGIITKEQIKALGKDGANELVKSLLEEHGPKFSEDMKDGLGEFLFELFGQGSMQKKMTELVNEVNSSNETIQTLEEKLKLSEAHVQRLQAEASAAHSDFTDVENEAEEKSFEVGEEERCLIDDLVKACDDLKKGFVRSIDPMCNVLQKLNDYKKESGE